jgi:simple sugar transport system substrate-binding protein
MVRAMRHAIAGKADGIAVSIIDPTAFNEATQLALSHGIPVISYNADGGRQNKRLAYIGQDNYQSGIELGSRVARLCSSGDVYLFIATPGQQNIQPRIDGALDAIPDDQQPFRGQLSQPVSGSTTVRHDSCTIPIGE